MRIQQITLRGFQSYSEEQVIDIDEHLTLLAGRNNVGKSAVLRALQTQVETQKGAAQDFQITYTWSITKEDVARQLSSRPGTEQVRDWLLPDAADSQLLTVSYAGRESDGTTRPDGLRAARVSLPDRHAEVTAGRASWDLPMEPSPVSDAALAEVMNLAAQATRRVLYLAPRSVEKGPRQFGYSDELLPDARNLANVLLQIQLSDPQGTFREIVSILNGAFPDLEAISVRPAKPPGGGSQLQGEPEVYFEGRDQPIPLELCGTGIEQMLALTVGVLTAGESKLILIDEPQAYLHPHAERSMLRLLDDHPEHQYIVATHSHVLLRSQPLPKARLLSLEHGATRVARVENEQQALGELGVTAADLWLVDRLLWVEGASEERVFGLLAAAKLSDAEHATLGICRMPEASRFAARSQSKADATFRFCAEVARAVRPVAVRMLFVFDGDEKSEQFRQRLQESSGGRAEFLPVRELENLFLRADLLYRGLTALCEQAEIPAPDLPTVGAKLDDLLLQHDDPDVYPLGALKEGQNAKAVIRGSKVLGRMWADLALADYDKVADGERLARASIETGGDELAPLAHILERLSSAGSS